MNAKVAHRQNGQHHSRVSQGQASKILAGSKARLSDCSSLVFLTLAAFLTFRSSQLTGDIAIVLYIDLLISYLSFI